MKGRASRKGQLIRLCSQPRLLLTSPSNSLPRWRNSEWRNRNGSEPLYPKWRILCAIGCAPSGAWLTWTARPLNSHCPWQPGNPPHPARDNFLLSKTRRASFPSKFATRYLTAFRYLQKCASLSQKRVRQRLNGTRINPSRIFGCWLRSIQICERLETALAPLFARGQVHELIGSANALPEVGDCGKFWLHKAIAGILFAANCRNRMSETSDNAIPSRSPNRADYKSFLSWFWFHAQELHGVGDDYAPLQSDALRLFQHFATQRPRHGDEAIHSMRQDRAGTLALRAVTICKANREGLDLPNKEKTPATKPDLQWESTIFETSGAWMFFRQAIEEFLW